jgi:hypothetical protein
MRYLSRMDAGAINEDQDLFEMVNIRPELSGLPFIVWISEKGGARHDVRVKREFSATVSVRPKIEVLAGELSPRDLQLVHDWIELNRDTIIRYWNGDILYTDEALAALKPLSSQG